jgi:hypothetical protein
MHEWRLLEWGVLDNETVIDLVEHCNSVSKNKIKIT